ncbi:GntT/GntP/DsdX family permease [Pedobacter terrae]|uniref:GntT/GntP/DsdX family permease n=1 Tax=Pedobacter terrae TaxID=405671 RepID=UPI002FF6B72C
MLTLGFKNITDSDPQRSLIIKQFTADNDSSFWLFKAYLGLSIKQTFLSWSLMETLVSVIGIIGILILDQVK